MTELDRKQIELIIRHINQILEISANNSQEELNSSPILFNAICFSLIHIGECTNNLSAEFCEQNNEIDWKLLVGMRNRLAHSYETIKKEIVVRTVHEQIPELLDYLQSLTEEENTS